MGPEREGEETERDGVGAGKEEGGNQEKRAKGFASPHGRWWKVWRRTMLSGRK